jgi:hypothetical protein
VIDKLEQVVERYEELQQIILDPNLHKNPKAYKEAMQEHSHLGEIVETYGQYKDAMGSLEEARAMLQDDDAEMKAMAQEEIADLEPRIADLESRLKILLVPRDPLDGKTSSWRSVPAPEATKRRCSPPTCTACTAAMLKKTAGNTKSSPSAKPRSAASRK